MKLSPLERARRYLANCPPAVSGQHGHDRTFYMAAQVWNGFGLSEPDTLAVLGEWNTRCEPPWTQAELLHKVQSVAHAPHPKPRGYLLGEELRPLPGQAGGRLPVRAPLRPAKPAFQPMVLKRVAARVADLGDPVEFLKNRSPEPVDQLDSRGFLERLYPAGSGEKVLLLTNMKSQGQWLWCADRSAATGPRGVPQGGDGVWFLPQPVDGGDHPNPRLGGKSSRRSEEAVTSWRYVVLESDKAPDVEWLRLLLQLPLRIVSICESGGRSIHALVRLDATSKADWDAQVATMKRTLVTLGADGGALSAVRLSRLPQALRGTRCQRLLYLNPHADGVPLLQ